MLICPKCRNNNGALIEQWNHLRTQMDCYCNVCSHSWVEVFRDLPKENIIPKTLVKNKEA